MKSMRLSKLRIRSEKIALFSAIQVILIGLLVSTSAGQTVPIEKGWNGILPLESTKGEVEKVFGKPYRVDDDGHYNYRRDDFVVQVNYVEAPCRANKYNHIKVNLPADTVLDTWVYLTKAILMSDLSFNRTSYNRDTSAIADNVVKYINRDAGIRIDASIFPDKKEYAVAITYKPSASARLRVACPE
jgi:hypothetical protein